jgi:hypothetical protein
LQVKHFAKQLLKEAKATKEWCWPKQKSVN